MLFMSIQINAQFLDSIGINITGGKVLSEFSMSQQGHFGSTLGANIEIPIGRFSISTGIEMSNYGSQYNFTRKIANESAGSQNPYEVKSYDFKYLSIPLKAKFIFYKNIYVQVGVKSETFQNQNLEMLGSFTDVAYENKPFHPIEMIRKKNFTLETSLGFTYYPKHSSLRLFFEPTIGYMLKPIHKNSSSANNQMIFGLKLGVVNMFKI